MRKKRVKIKSITQRWMVNTLSVVLAALLFLAVIFAFGMRNFYYSAARQALDARANLALGVLLRISSSNTVNFNTELRNLVENSDEKDKLEVTAIDHSGRIALSSSGFSYQRQEEMPDYEEALHSATGKGDYIGRSSEGEKIMAMSVMIPSITAEYSAVRYVVSLEDVDRQLVMYMLVFGLIALLILGFVMLSGLFFVKSIVIPVREVGAAARKFATGDMSERIEKKSDDELGELCDIINFMADEISNSEELKNEFISSVSHELRTPLTAIKGWSETLATQEYNTPEDRQMLEKGMRIIGSETDRLSGMVEELLDFSRIQNGKLALVKTRIDLLAELGEAVMIYTERARRDGIELIYHEPDMISPIFGDKNRLRQVFINIIDNALKYSDAGDTVIVSARQIGGWIVVGVEDTGCGISEEDLPNIKTKFYKANLSRRGSGIGLAVANEIVLMHGGEIDIQSKLGEGTKVTIRLPVDQKKAGERSVEFLKNASLEEQKIDETNGN